MSFNQLHESQIVFLASIIFNGSRILSHYFQWAILSFFLIQTPIELSATVTMPAKKDCSIHQVGDASPAEPLQCISAQQNSVSWWQCKQKEDWCPTEPSACLMRLLPKHRATVNPSWGWDFASSWNEKWERNKGTLANGWKPLKLMWQIWNWVVFLRLEISASLCCFEAG